MICLCRGPKCTISLLSGPKALFLTNTTMTKISLSEIAPRPNEVRGKEFFCTFLIDPLTNLTTSKKKKTTAVKYELLL